MQNVSFQNKLFGEKWPTVVRDKFFFVFFVFFILIGHKSSSAKYIVNLCQHGVGLISHQSD